MILNAALLCYFGVTVLNILNAGGSSGRVAAALLCMAGIYALQLVHSSAGAGAASARRKCLTLGAQAALTYLPLAVFSMYWGAMAGFLAGSILLLLPPRWAWPLYALIGASMLPPAILNDTTLVFKVYVVQTTLLTGVVTFGLTRLADVVRALHESREELGRMAVTRERLRFARDLHDLLGYSLSAITLKSELIRRLIAKQPDRAVAETQDVLAISRQALADVRAVASAYRDMSLEEEIRSARTTLGAAGMEVRAEFTAGAVGSRVDTVLATVLREAVTNVLRHSRASRCSIAAVRDGRLVRLTVTNDGVAAEYRDESPHGGGGLGSLAARLSAVGGTLAWQRGAGDTFRLVAEAPPGDADADTHADVVPEAGDRTTHGIDQPAADPDGDAPTNRRSVA
ncbi:histidine kinase [Embleya sp. NBC_00896]|uniref:sensor histidine kinase n=1 Tax=Embleya sp. NBC_00896 TaxID=2975961 RepID=UPI002F918F45|nr:histidine kinase [Embleya sp. NBC_00896]